MRKIDTHRYERATRSTAREVNRQIVLNLIRERGPISRAELARQMQVQRAALTDVVRDLVGAGLVAESEGPQNAVGRRPTMLQLRAGDGTVLAVDVRAEHTMIALTDLAGRVLVRDGEVLRGEAHTAGEFGHVTIDPRGPECACGKRGCWEAFTCNAAVVAAYHARRRGAGAPLTVGDVVERAVAGEPTAADTLAEVGWHVGRGLAMVVSAFAPGRLYLGGELAAAWPLVGRAVRRALAAEGLTDVARATPVVPDPAPAARRLLGAVALVVAPAFAATRVA